MLELYGGARSRASIVQWYLEELELPYEFVMLDLQAGEQFKPDYLAINPVGKVPAIVDGDFKLWESGAILQYLAEKYGSGFTTPEHRAELAQWVLFANATLGPGVFMESTRNREMPRLFKMLDQQFSQSDYLIGDRFTAADVAVGAMLAYFPLMLKINFDGYGSLDKYVKRLSERPAFQKTIGSRTSH